MTNKELKALISLLEDEDEEIVEHVEKKILSLGGGIISLLESEWESNLDPQVQKKIEDLIHQLQYDLLCERLTNWKNAGANDLIEGMWLVATYQYPDLDLDKLKEELEQFYYETWLEMKDDLIPHDQVKILNGVLFSKLKFSPNSKNFHSPANSMINMVIQSRRGNPISLCVIYLLIAQKLKLPVYGVNLPNLFVLTYKTKDVQFYINVFNRGLIFTKSDIESYIKQLNLKPSPVFFEPCTNIDIISRVIRNLMVSFDKLGERDKVGELQVLMRCINDGDESFDSLSEGSEE